VYQIQADHGVPLKIGIAVNLLKRLKSHRASRDRGLRWKKGTDRGSHDEVTSHSSTLAKHLYFDTTLAVTFELKTELGRRRFLAERWYALVTPMTLEGGSARREGGRAIGSLSLRRSRASAIIGDKQRI
jgi:hypothetical protein